MPYHIPPIFAIIKSMETKFSQPVPKKSKFRLRPGWQDRLPVRPLLLVAAFAVLLTLLILVNQPRSRVLNSAEIEMVRSTGVLRIGVDDGIGGLYQNGKGLETEIGLALGEAVFNSMDGITFVPCTRYSALWRMYDGYIDLALLSMQSFDNDNYARNTVPFYTEDCVLMGYEERPLEHLRIAVLNGTQSEEIAYRILDQDEPELVIVPCADYYSMMVKLRAGSVDAVCMPRTVSREYRERGMVIYTRPIGTLSYYAIAPSGSILLELCDEMFTEWTEDGTMRKWQEENGLVDLSDSSQEGIPD